MSERRNSPPDSVDRLPPTAHLPEAESRTETPIHGVVSFLSSNEKRGKWMLPRHMRALSVMGNVELDLRDAEIGVGVSVIEAVSILGNIEITVPPEIIVECDGDALLGNFTLQYQGRVDTGAARGDRKIRITGNAYLASVTVRVQGPDEDVLARLERTFAMFRR